MDKGKIRMILIMHICVFLISLIYLVFNKIYEIPIFLIVLSQIILMLNQYNLYKKSK